MEHLWNRSDTACLSCGMAKDARLISKQPECEKRAEALGKASSRPWPGSFLDVANDDALAKRRDELRRRTTRGSPPFIDYAALAASAVAIGGRLL